jgi:hypothetical protein
MRSFVALVLLALASCARVDHGKPPEGVQRDAKRAPVVVTIVVDQMAGWIAEERWPLLRGGFARLLREGTYFRDVRYAHAVTDTAPGHAALYTAKTPRESGIASNEVPEGPPGKRASILASGLLAPLRVETLADRLRAEHPAATIVSLSLKDRGALFAGGRKPDAVLWYSPDDAAFVTASGPLPVWSLPIAQHPLSVAPPFWELADKDVVRAHARVADEDPSEGDYRGLGRIFPHPITGAKESPARFRATPFGDAALLALADAALDALPNGKTTLLALSLSSNDYIGHVFGPNSWEAWDELVRLDAALDRFFAGLDRRYGADAWAALLTADHGVARAYEGRLVPTEIDVEMRKVAKSTLGEGEFIVGVADPYVFLTERARSLPTPERAKLKAALTAALLAHREDAQIFDVSTQTLPCPPESDESIPALVCRGSRADAGDLYIVTKPGAFFDAELAIGYGSSHGTPYLFDRSVPLVVRAPGRFAAGKRVDEPQSFRLFARIAAALLDVDFANSSP